MKTRLITAAVGVPFLIFTLVVRGWFAEFVIVALTFIAMYENYRALKKAGYVVCEWGGYVATAAMWPLSRLMGVLVAAMGVSMTGVMLHEKPAFPDAAASVYPLLTCFLPMSMFMMMMNSTYGVVPGIALITMAFAIAYAGDGAAYFGGRALGRHKLCPNVSPKKTVEGAIFGVIGGTLAGLACEIGDLSASLLKRHSGIKDYGHIFPGHGGVMDRFDSVIFTLIVMYCYTLVL